MDIEEIKKRITDRLAEGMESFGKGIAQGLDSKGLTNTGATKRSLTVSVQQQGNRITATLSGAANLGALTFGAKPITQRTDGKFVESIQAWAMTKLGLPSNEARGFAFAYLKRRTGQTKGGNWRTTRQDGSYFVPNPYNPGDVVTAVVNDDTVAQLVEEVMVAARRGLGIEITKMAQDGN